MAASTLAAVAPPEVVLLGENNIAFGRIVIVIIRQMGDFFLRRLRWHRVWASVEEAVFLKTNGRVDQLVADFNRFSL
jgi:hypothetical protein